MFRKYISFCLSLFLLVSFLMPVMSVSTALAAGSTTDWAIVISGGANQVNNHARYWNDISEIYEILTVNYGYAEDEVFVLYADGNPPSATNCDDPGNVHGSYPTDIIDYSATSANISTVTAYIDANGHCGDTLFVFVTDHGGGGGSLNLWHESISAATFANLMNNVSKYCWRAFELEQCFSGEMIPDLSGPNTAIATAAGNTTSCGAGGSLFFYDPFVYYFNAALKGEFPSPAGGGTIDPSSWSASDVTSADADSDGKVSFVEAYNYAYPLSTCDEDERYDDNGDGVRQTNGPMPAGGDGELGALLFLGEQTDNPIANAGPDQNVEQTYYQGADVTLDGSGSSDPGGDSLTYSWTWDGGSTTGVSPTVSLPLGETPITLEVDNGILQSGCSDTVVITVVDTTPPVLTVPADVTVEQEDYEGTPVSLDPATATDICDTDVDITDNAPAVFPLGQTVVTFTATDDSGNSATGSTTVTVVDTTPPDVWCIPFNNPSGKEEPTGKAKGKGVGENPDGFYQLKTFDICDPEPQIYITDTGSGAVFGPFAVDTVIKYTEDADATPEMKKIGSDNGKAGAVSWHIIGNGDACVSAVDYSGNVADCTSCLVPGPPK